MVLGNRPRVDAHNERMGALIWGIVWAFFPILVAIAGALMRGMARDRNRF